ncbi:hypothetical protein [Microbacterium sp. LMI1-1-1.1]|uniref:hypothetical protein n=1 Tax=Microbacterium sp. LMI1-1-1.1 TaxID=3135223 RepID=UPI003466DD3F
MTLPPVASERAESASRLLNLTLGLHRIQSATPERSDSKPRLGDPAFDGVQVQRQATWLRLISITETFCADRLLDAAEAEVAPDGSPIRGLVWDKASTAAISSWPAMKDAYNSWYGIKPNWAKVETLIEVRNAIAHGLGELTRFQRRKRSSLVTKFNHAGVHLSGNRVVISENNLSDVRDGCSELIVLLDAEVAIRTARP